ncbi:hypothetical protein ACFL41_02630, partial [Gemmatimonadota bacterium]
SYKPWNLVWDESTSSLLFNHSTSEELYSVRVDKHGEAVGAIESLGWASSFTDFDYSAATGQYVIVSRTRDSRIVALDVTSDDPFTPIVQGYTAIRSLAASRDANVLYFVEILADRGMQIHAYSKDDSVFTPLPEDIRYRDRRDPTPFPLSDRYMVFRGYDGRNEGLYYYDRDRMQYQSLVSDPSSDLIYDHLNWNPAGTALYSILNPSPPSTRDRSLVRLNIRSDEEGLSVTSIDTLLSLPDLQHTIPGPENRYVFYVQGNERTSGDIYLFDLITGNTRHVTNGTWPALGNGGKNLYFYRNAAIWVVRDWQEAIGTTITPEHIADTPTGDLTLASDHPLVLAGDTLFLAYSINTGTEILWSYTER